MVQQPQVQNHLKQKKSHITNSTKTIQPQSHQGRPQETAELPKFAIEFLLNSQNPSFLKQQMEQPVKAKNSWIQGLISH